MKKAIELREFSYHLAAAAGAAPTVELAGDAWRMLALTTPKWQVLWPTVVKSALNAPTNCLLELIQEKNLWGFETAVEVWKGALAAQNHSMVAALMDHSEFQKQLKNDKKGDFADVYVQAHEAMRSTGFESLLGYANYSEDVLNATLFKVIFQAKRKWQEKSIEKMVSALLDQGASPFDPDAGKMANIPDAPPQVSAVLYLAGNACSYSMGDRLLKILSKKLGEEAVLSHQVNEKRFVPFWVGGSGNVSALLDVLYFYSDRSQISWLEGDRFFVIGDALRLAIHGKMELFNAVEARLRTANLTSKIPSSAITPLIDQAFRMSMMHFSRVSSASPEASKLRAIEHVWDKEFPTLSSLFEDPSRWVWVCQEAIRCMQEAGLDKTRDITQRSLDTIALECGATTHLPSRVRRM